MENLKLKKIALILAPILTPLSVYLLMRASGNLHHMLSFSIGYTLYWFFWCLAFPLWLLGRQGLKKMLKTSAEPFGRPALLGALLLFIPLVISLLLTAPFESERELWPQATWLMLLMAIPMSVWNGFLEEVLWRGTFTAIFPRQTMLGIIYPALGFAAWHLGPFLAKSPWDNQQVLMLLGGGTVLGLCWNYMAAKTGTIRYTIYSHILANICLFTALSMV